MNINALNLYGGFNSATCFNKTAGNGFADIFNKAAGDKTADEICRNYDINLNVGNIEDYRQIIGSSDIRCTNYVRISPETLRKMENDPALKNKILHAVGEFCDPAEQAKVKALQPPVKSSGMIVNPDGSALYWIEGYPNNSGSDRSEVPAIKDYYFNNAAAEYINFNNPLPDVNLNTNLINPAPLNKLYKEII